MTQKPTVPEVLERFCNYHKLPGNNCWGSLHVIFEDGNYRDGNIQWCLEYAQEEGKDLEGIELLKILTQMSVTQRIKLKRLA